MSIVVLLGCGHKAAMNCLGQVLGHPKLEKRTDQHEDFLAGYVEMDGRAIALCSTLQSLPKDQFFPVHCKDIEVIKMDYHNLGVYATCDSWFCFGMDNFQNATGGLAVEEQCHGPWDSKRCCEITKERILKRHLKGSSCREMLFDSIRKDT